MKKNLICILGIGIMLLFAAQVLAIDSTRQDRLDFGYVLNVNNATTMPVTLVAGANGVVKLILENNANFPIYDIRIDLTLPSQVSFVDDVSKSERPRINVKGR